MRMPNTAIEINAGISERNILVNIPTRIVDTGIPIERIIAMSGLIAPIAREEQRFIKKARKTIPKMNTKPIITERIRFAITVKASG